MAPGVIHLKDVATARTVVRLEDPHGDRATWQGFTPDGTKLVVVARYDGAIHVWDLRAIRTRLEGMKLDWNWDQFQPGAQSPAAVSLSTLEVDPGDLSRPPSREDLMRQDIERLRREVEGNPQSATLCNTLAWAYLTAPGKLRDVPEGMRLARKAVQLAKGTASFSDTMGLAHYRSGQYREAVDVLRANLPAAPDRYLTYGLYFLALSHQGLGEAERAREYYDWAVRWGAIQTGLNSGQLEELALFRAETEESLGITQKKD
jgi:hypothetical protein